jgi:uncharacterized protein (TIGR02117 family)
MRVAGRIAAVLALLLILYGVAGVIGGALPANSGWRPPAQGVTIWVENNGIHVDLVVPKVAAGVDWRPYAPAADLAVPRFAGHDHLAIGWGDKAFFLGTPTWADIRPGTSAAAALGRDATLLHVEHVPRPRAGSDARAVVLRPEEYRRLAAFIAGSFRPHPRHYRGYDRYDAFYDSRGHYNAFRTCNAWAGDALRHAGVRVGRWTPFPGTVMSWF